MKLTILKAVPADYSELSRLWNEIFYDNFDYIGDVFEHFFIKHDNSNNIARYNYILTARDGDKIVAMAFMINYELVDMKDNSSQRCEYLYALATLPEYRKQGLMTQIIDEIKNDAMANGCDGLCLIPADSDLKNYYSKRGFEEICTSKKEVSILQNNRVINLLDESYQGFYEKYKSEYKDYMVYALSDRFLSVMDRLYITGLPQ